MIHITNTGAAIRRGTQSISPPGRDRRKAANRLTATTLATNPILSQNIGNMAASARSRRMLISDNITNSAPSAPRTMAFA